MSADLLAALTAERYDNRWWKTKPTDDAATDDDMTTARRRRALAADYDTQNKKVS
jgi:hypothetical protein